ncbi:LuxR C-terminal-related transcriptional regulator [Dactylosporangium sp. NPDC005572]|uniref:helix-turn-helix transcriptional regulator n=1 Tax=Dactylosporangium sp. NPDC005572 TaxID=3156889 RepID=UPI0033A2C65E
MLRIAEAPDLGDDGDGLPWSILHELRGLVRCEVIEFGSFDASRRSYFYDQGLDQPAYDPDQDDVFWDLFPTSCGFQDPAQPYRTVRQSTDRYTLAEMRRTPLYLEFCRPLGLHHSLQACWQAGAGRELRLVLHRGRHDPDFDDRDRGLITLLRPHVLAAHRALLRRRDPVPDLTSRQWELLRLIEDGLTNRQIARHLSISEHTVRKHLENVFARLEVASRTAALRRAFP